MARIYSRAYQLTKVLTATNREVVLYLYEGALSLLGRAAADRAKGKLAEAGESVDRVIAILIELSSCLDYNRNGELALRLDSIYNYMIHALTLSNSSGDVETINTCEGILNILGDAWRQAISMEKTAQAEPVPQLRLSA
jgi:flagellar protein FliS